METNFKHIEELLKQAKVSFLQDIIDSNLPNLRKLQFISDNELLPIKSYMQEIWVEGDFGKIDIVEDYFVDREYNRGTIVNLFKICQYPGDNFPDDKGITDLQIIDACYDWVIKNQAIGFTWDW
jgi:hypothetical protein